jgi:hypothetical protein
VTVSTAAAEAEAGDVVGGAAQDEGGVDAGRRGVVIVHLIEDCKQVQPLQPPSAPAYCVHAAFIGGQTDTAYFTAPITSLPGTTSVLTMVNGRVVFDAGVVH